MDTETAINAIFGSSALASHLGSDMFRTRVPFELLRIEKDEKAFESLRGEVSKSLRDMQIHLEFLSRAHNAMTQEIRAAMRTADPMGAVGAVEDEFSESHLASEGNFLNVSFKSLSALRNMYAGLHELIRGLDPGPMDPPPEESKNSWEGMQRAQLLSNMYGPALNKFIGSVLGIEVCRSKILELTYGLSSTVETYYKVLLKRHSTDGVQVHGNPIRTDIALSIFANVDSHGEIEMGDDVDRVSAYTVRKAQILIRALEEEPIKGFITRTGGFLTYLDTHLKALWRIAEKLNVIFGSTIRVTKEQYEGTYRRIPSKMEFDSAIQILKDLDPDLVPYKDRAVLMTAEERFQVQFMNETLDNMIQLMTWTEDGTAKLIKYVLERKAELKNHDQKENGFFICKIGDGNKFQQKPPGMLEVVPGECPTINIEDIWGSGFDEIREFLNSIEMSAQWHDLFVATSPSKTADKSNMLMIGPQGCGKSQAMRGIGADEESITIFAQGSDFLTCWMGEADKNPKRLFQAAVRLQKESGKQVYILIDEIDSVMKKQELKSHGEVDLTLEFQILMDGVVHYPHLTVVGATNRPGHIPMPMIRRFSKVLIVGELDEADRVKILKHYTGFMPTKGFKDRDWKSAALKLDGATGDVLRKVIDVIWRKKMTWFVKNQAEKAAELKKWLNDGTKFQISDFDAKRRAEFKKLLGPFVKIEPADLSKSIDAHLKNVAIQGEIRTARQTYQEAHELLDDLNSSGLILTK